MDAEGFAYVTGQTTSLDFPTLPEDDARHLYPDFFGGDTDAFVVKVNRLGTGLEYSTYLGGEDSDRGFGIAVDDVGHAYVTGSTQSTDFPIFPRDNNLLGANAFQTEIGGFPCVRRCNADAFVTKLQPAGNALVYSTFLGSRNADRGREIAVDAFQKAYVTGTNFFGEFPTTMNAHQPNFGGGGTDAFVAKIIPPAPPEAPPPPQPGFPVQEIIIGTVVLLLWVAGYLIFRRRQLRS